MKWHLTFANINFDYAFNHCQLSNIFSIRPWSFVFCMHNYLKNWKLKMSNEIKYFLSWRGPISCIENVVTRNYKTFPRRPTYKKDDNDVYDKQCWYQLIYFCFLKSQEVSSVGLERSSCKWFDVNICTWNCKSSIPYQSRTRSWLFGTDKALWFYNILFTLMCKTWIYF